MQRHSARSVATLAGLTLLMLASLLPEWGTHYSEDAYAYLHLGRSLVHGHGFVNATHRDLQVPEVLWPAPSRSFAPLNAVVIGALEMLTGSPFRALAYAGAVGLIACCVAWWVLCGQLLPSHRIMLFLVLPVTLWTFAGFRMEVTQAGSIPLNMALILGYISCEIARSSGDWMRGFSTLSAGVLIALLFLNRFENLLPLAMLAVLALVTGEAEARMAGRTQFVAGLLHTAAPFAIAALLVCPWVIHTLLTWGVPVTSDNGGTALSVAGDRIPLRYFAQGFPTFFDNPSGWLQRRLIFAVSKSLETLRIAPSLVLAGILALGLGHTDRAEMQFARISLVFVVFSLATLSLTEYFDERYLAFAYFAGLAASLILTSALLGGIPPVPMTAILGAILLATQPFATVLDVGWIKSAVVQLRNGHAGEFRPSEEADHWSATAREIRRVAGSKGDPVIAIDKAEFLAHYGGFRTVYLPRNVTSPGEDYDAWRDRFCPDYLVAPHAWVKNMRFPAAMQSPLPEGRILVTLRGCRSQSNGSATPSAQQGKRQQ